LKINDAAVLQAQDLSKDILAHETKVWDTFLGVSPNIEAFEQLLAPGYLCIEAIGVLMTKEDNIAELKRLTFASYKIQDAQVIKLSLNSALIVARVKFEGTAHGHPMSGEALSSTVWVRQGDKWLAQLHTETFKKSVPTQDPVHSVDVTSSGS
jgi:hypothetical protein